jgi:hypothetical protein
MSDHDHKPIQHRDGKPPWCPVCKLTADGQVPKASWEATDPADPLIPWLRVTEAVIKEWRGVVKNPVKHQRFMRNFPALAVELAHLSEHWGDG